MGLREACDAVIGNRAERETCLPIHELSSILIGFAKPDSKGFAFALFIYMCVCRSFCLSVCPVSARPCVCVFIYLSACCPLDCREAMKSTEGTPINGTRGRQATAVVPSLRPPAPILVGLLLVAWPGASFASRFTATRSRWRGTHGTH